MMPVLPVISEAIQMGLKTLPSAPPQVVGSITAASQASMAASALTPGFPSPKPVIPIGATITSALMIIGAMLFLSFEITSKIIQQLLDQYVKDYKKAVEAQKAAIDELYTLEKNRQVEIKDKITELEEEIITTDEEITELETIQKDELSKYKNKIFEYKEKGKKAEDEGLLDERDIWYNKVEELDSWLAEIILMVIEITNKKIDKLNKEIELEKKIELSELTIKKEWAFLEEWADDFEVAIPYYPDLPFMPSFPVIPPIPKIPEQVKALRKSLAIFFCTPALPPIGIAIGAIIHEIMSLAPNPSAVAAKKESVANSLIMKLGGAF